jgi:hypothetical protein
MNNLLETRLGQHSAVASSLPATLVIDQTNDALGLLADASAKEYKGTCTICADPQHLLREFELLGEFGFARNEAALQAALLQLGD